MKYTPKVKKETPPPDSIACLKCNEVFPNVDELTKHEKKCYIKYSYNCLDSTCHRTFSQKSLMNQHYRSTRLVSLFCEGLKIVLKRFHLKIVGTGTKRLCTK